MTIYIDFISTKDRLDTRHPIQLSPSVVIYVKYIENFFVTRITKNVRI